MALKKYNLIVNFLLCCFGLSFWYAFNSYLPSLLHADWFKENVYLDVFRDAIVHNRIPYEYFISIKPDYTRFLAIPEICLLPDIFLLPYLTNAEFFFIHTAIFFLIGNYGLYLYTKEWSLTASAFTFTLFNFNGFILSHLAEGHFQFLGYFTFPLYFRFITNCIISEPKNQKLLYASLTGFLIGFNFLNGSTHTAVWMCISTGCVLLFAGSRNLFFLFLSLFISALVGAARLIPSSLYFGHISGFITGYPSTQILIDSFVKSHGPHFATQLSNGLSIGWWEFDFFLGWIGATLVSTLLIRSLFTGKLPLPKSVLAACFILIIFSLGNTYELITQLPISIAKVERISSRFIALPMVGLLLIFGSQLNNLNRISKVIATLFIGSTIEIFKNASHYLTDTEMSNRSVASIFYIDPTAVNISYMTASQIGIFVSAFSILAILLFIIIWNNRRSSSFDTNSN